MEASLVKGGEIFSSALRVPSSAFLGRPNSERGAGNAERRHENQINAGRRVSRFSHVAKLQSTPDPPKILSRLSELLAHDEKIFR